MSANIKIRITSRHGGKTSMHLNPDQMALLVDILDGHRDLGREGAFGPWFVKNLILHAKEN